MRVTDDKSAEAYAKEWAGNWNRKDLDAILTHFADDVVFSSPKALDTMGVPTVQGKPELREYWRRALSRIQTIDFKVVRVIWDAQLRELAIIYDRHVNGRHDRAAEVLCFGSGDLVVRGEVFYGVIP